MTSRVDRPYIKDTAKEYVANNGAVGEALPPAFYEDDNKIQNLRKIKIEACPIQYFGQSLAIPNSSARIMPNFWRLRELVITDGKLLVLPSGLAELTHLRKLDVSGNVIKVIPERTVGPNLREFNFSTNLVQGPLPLQEIATSNLKVLIAHNNDLVPEDFKPDDELEEMTVRLEKLSLDQRAVTHGKPPLPLENYKPRFRRRVVGKLVVIPNKSRTPRLERSAKASALDVLQGVQKNRKVRIAYEVALEGSQNASKRFSVETTQTSIEVKSVHELMEIFEQKETHATAANFKNPKVQITSIDLNGDPDLETAGEQGLGSFWDMVLECSNLTILKIRGCNLKEVPEEVFTKLTSLDEVDFSTNVIKNIPVSFSEARGLRNACFRNNNIRAFPKIPQSLASLDLSENYLGIERVFDPESKGIKRTDFSDARGLNNLDLRSNPLLPGDFFYDQHNDLPEHLKLISLKLDEELRYLVGFELAPGGMKELFAKDRIWQERIMKNRFYHRYLQHQTILPELNKRLGLG